jgi:glutaredoxin domain-containing cysteine-rich protein 1
VSLLQSFKEKDTGKVVVYTTSMGIIRETYTKCATVKQILRTLLVKFEERDVFMSNEYQQEIRDRMHSEDIEVPQLFVDGHHVGVRRIAQLSLIFRTMVLFFLFFILFMH